MRYLETVYQRYKRRSKESKGKILGIDSDNGSEFINYHLLSYCEQRGIQFTRSRPYKKDDNAHIEQKNWTHMRKFHGLGPLRLAKGLRSDE